MVRLEVPADDYQTIEREIQSPESPVGIDAKHTHVIVLHKLAAIEERLDRLEASVAEAVAALGAVKSAR